MVRTASDMPGELADNLAAACGQLAAYHEHLALMLKIVAGRLDREAIR